MVVSLLATGTLAQWIQGNSVQPLPFQNSESAQQNRTITEQDNYNALDHAGMGIGLVDINDKEFSVEISGLTQSLEHDTGTIVKKNTGFSLPSLIVGNPGKFAFAFNYGVTPLYKTISEGVNLRLPLHRTGLHIASHADSSNFRFAFDFDMFVGKSTYKENPGNSSRTVIGIDKVGISFGGQPEPMFTFDIGLAGNGFVDTLAGGGKERFSSIMFPHIELSVDVGDTSLFPLLSSFSYDYARDDFVYVLGGDRDPIVTDSINWHLQNRFQFEPIAQKLAIAPSIAFGYWHNRHKLMKPSGDNYPKVYKGERDGYRWETKNFTFGFGFDAEFFKCTEYWLEFSHDNLTLDLLGSNYNQDDDQKEGFNRFATGAEVSIFDIPALNYTGEHKLWFSLSFLTQEESGIYRSYYGNNQYEHLRDVKMTVELWRYKPEDNIDHRIKTNDFTIGVRGEFADEKLETGLRIHFVNQEHIGVDDNVDTFSYGTSGNRFQWSIAYNIPR